MQPPSEAAEQPPPGADGGAAETGEDAALSLDGGVADEAWALGGDVATPARRTTTIAALEPAERLRRLLRLDSIVVTIAVLLHVAAGVVAAAVMAALDEEDWWLYLLMGLLTAVVLTNYGRLGARVTLLRRGLSGLFALSMVAVWGVLLADRVRPAVTATGRVAVGADRPELWWAVGLEVATALLLLLHMVWVAPRARSAKRRARAERQRARQAAAVAAGLAETKR